MLIKCRKLHKGANGFHTFPPIKANDNSMDGEKQVVIRLLECLCYCVEFSFVGAGIVGLRLAGHTADKITMHAHSNYKGTDLLQSKFT